MVKDGFRLVRTSNAYTFSLEATQQAVNAAQALFEKAKRVADHARTRYQAFLHLGDRPSRNPETYYSKGPQAPQMSREDMLIYLGQWDEERKINAL